MIQVYDVNEDVIQNGTFVGHSAYKVRDNSRSVSSFADVGFRSFLELRSKIASKLRHAYNCAYIWITNLCYTAGRFL